MFNISMNRMIFMMSHFSTFSFAFTAMVIVLLIGLSIWIITTADALMLR